MDSKITFKKRPIAAACAAILGASISQLAVGATTSGAVSTAFYGADANQVINATLDNSAAISTSVAGSTGGITTTTGSGSALTLDVDTNVIGALATGNSFDSGVDLALIDEYNASATATGIAALGVDINSGAISSSVTTSGFTESNTGVTAGSFSVSDNLLVAQTTINSGVTTTSGVVPSGFTSDVAGSGTLTFGGTATAVAAESEATIAASTLQINTAGQLAGSTATVDGNDATLTMTPDAGVDQSVAATLAVDGNVFSADYTGNVETSTAVLGTGGTPDFTGTVAVTSLQANVDDTGTATTVAATNNSTDITATVSSTTGAETETLIGTLTQSDNQVSASATGNKATNGVSLQDGLSFTGVTAATDPGTSISLVDAVDPNTQLSAAFNADLGVLSVQINDAANLSSATSATTITSVVQSLDGGSVVQDNNSVTASTLGSQATNSITAVNANSLDGSVAIASAEVNRASDISALTTGSTIEAKVGNYLGGTDTGLLTDATVSITSSEISASATGSQVGNTLSLSGNALALGDVTDGALMATLSGTVDSAGTLAVNAGASLTSVQQNIDSAVTATTSDSLIKLNAEQVDPSTNVSASALTVDSNVIDTTAFGTRGDNAITIDASSLTGSVALGSDQSLDSASDVTATQTNSTVTASIDTGILNTVVELAGNMLRSMGYGNLVNNDVSISATNASSPSDGLDGTTTTAEASTLTLDGSIDPAVNAAYGLLSNQSTAGDVTVANASSTINMDIIDTPDNSTLTNDSNIIVAAGYANGGSNTLALQTDNLSVSGTGTDTFGPVANVSSVQSVADATAVSSAITYPNIYTFIDNTATQSTISLANNTVQAVSVGNNQTGSLSATGNSLIAMPSSTEGALQGLSFDGEGSLITADSGLSLQNLQRFGAGITYSEVSDANLENRIDTNDLIDSSMTLTGNKVLASTVNNQTGNSVDLTGYTTLQTTAGLQSAQQTTGSALATISFTNIEQYVSLLAQDSSMTLSDNVVQSAASGNTADNSVSIQATNVTVPGDGLVADTLAGSSVNFFNELMIPLVDVAASFGLLNTQSGSGDVTATTDSSVFSSKVWPAVDSVINVDDNSLAAIANGNQTSNGMTIDAGNLLVDGVATEVYGPVASVTNLQALSDLSTIAVTASVTDTNDSSEFYNYAGTDGGEGTLSASGSTMSVSGNTVQAQAYANNALDGNSLTVTGNSIIAAAGDDGALSGLTSNSAGTLTADLAFSVQNGQATGSGTTTAQLDGIDALLRASGDVTGSTLATDTNRFVAAATTNVAVNALDMTDITTLQTTAGVQSYQTSASSTVADLGTAATVGTEAVVYTGSLSSTTVGDGATMSGTTLNAGTTDFSIDISSLTAEEQTALASLLTDVGFTQSGTILTLSSGSTVNLVGLFNGLSTNVDGGTGYITSFSFDGFNIAGTDATNASPSVVIEVDGDIANSQLSVDANVFSASAITNDVSNALAISANDISEASSLTANANSAYSLTTGATEAVADFAVANVQVLEYNADATADAFSTLAIDTVNTTATTITDSALTITNNAQEARAQGNRASNSLSLTATNLGDATTNGASSMLLSSQVATEVDITATSDMMAFAPGSLTNSSLEISGNSNSAVATLNQATNQVSVTGTNLLTSFSLDANATVLADETDVIVTADVGLNNVQRTLEGEGAPTVTATATTTLVNDEAYSVGVNTLSGSSVALNSNVTDATANSNRAVNALSLDGSTTAATGALINDQINAAATTATATSTVRFVLNTGAADAASLATIFVDGNKTSATASGNSSTNTLSALGSAGYDNVSADGATTVLNGGSSAGATYAMLNGQSNTAAISATALNANYGIELNGVNTGVGTNGAVSGSAYSVSGNEVLASSYGNSAVNQMSLSSLPYGSASGALVNSQYNSGAISATVTAASFNATTTGTGISANTGSVSANRALARAVGNSVVNRITAK